MRVSGRYFAAAAFVVYLLAGVLIYSDYAVSWDEPTSRMNGLVNLKYVDGVVGSGALQEELRSIPDLSTWQDRDYAVAFELPLAAAERLTGVEGERIWPLRHLLTLVLSALGVFAIYRTARLAYANQAVALAAAILMALSPRVFAESFYNSKDIAFMAAMAISTWTLTRVLISGRVEAMVLHGVATGFAIDIRIMGVVLLPLTIILLVIQMVQAKRSGGHVFRLFLLYTFCTAAAVYVMFPFLWGGGRLFGISFRF
ncbi:phospholipid carrier-dependent glycosyltransferase [Salmonella enterica subsp. enterica]|nr:phospholipid carrier-dependent glycosyltransferase [Salmonella enterica subsp. enterica serovar Litchfield]